MMTAKIILSNNPLVFEESNEYQVEAVSGREQAAVYDAALALLQSGHKLLSAPLPPNVPLMRAPYRSLVLEKSGRQYDPQGILAVEKARERMGVVGAGTYTEKQALDAAFIDQELLKRTIRECRSNNNLTGLA